MADCRQEHNRKMHKLRPLRLERAWTQEDLAKAAGISTGTVLRLEKGARAPFPTTVRKLAEALGVDVRVLTKCGPPAEGDS